MSDRVRKDGSRFGIRIIQKGGRVRWLRRWWRIQDGSLAIDAYAQLSLDERVRRENRPKYDGRLDGLRGLFYNYRDHQEPHLHSIEGAEWPGPQCIHGVFCWDYFDPEVTA